MRKIEAKPATTICNSHRIYIHSNIKEQKQKHNNNNEKREELQQHALLALWIFQQMCYTMAHTVIQIKFIYLIRIHKSSSK